MRIIAGGGNKCKRGGSGCCTAEGKYGRLLLHSSSINLKRVKLLIMMRADLSATLLA